MPYWSQSFDGRPGCVADVREYTGTVIDGSAGADLVELVASELAVWVPIVFSAPTPSGSVPSQGSSSWLSGFYSLS